jgi:hypothetical protein
LGSSIPEALGLRNYKDSMPRIRAKNHEIPISK